jgi:hypothetical protein
MIVFSEFDKKENSDDCANNSSNKYRLPDPNVRDGKNGKKSSNQREGPKDKRN